MKMTDCICDECGVGFQRPTKEVTRRAKQGSIRCYCSVSCASKNSSTDHLKSYAGQYNHNLNPGSSKDEYSVVREYLRRARNRKDKGETNLTLEYLLEIWNQQKGICPITGIAMVPVYTTTKDYRNPYHASLDRIDCSKGYIQGNVRFTTAIANMARNCWDDETLIDFCKKVAENNP